MIFKNVSETYIGKIDSARKKTTKPQKNTMTFLNI